MQVSTGVILAIRAAYKSGVINFETYHEIKKNMDFKIRGPGCYKPGFLQGGR